MLIKQLEKKDSLIARKFLEPYEYSCIMLASLIQKTDSSVYVVLSNSEITRKEDILGLFSYNGTMHHCLPFLAHNQLAFSEFAAVFINFLSKQEKKLRCLNGLEATNELLLSFLQKVGIIPYQKNNYNLLVLNSSPVCPPEKLQNDDFIKRCTRIDFDELFNLQKEYLLSEVVPAGKNLSDLECNLILKDILRTEICEALVTDGEFAAKANTNAIGWNFVQLGGVYTNPLYRRNYYAWWLIYDLCNLIQKKQKKVCLFVNIKNTAALNLYKRIGFSAVDRFEICYFN